MDLSIKIIEIEKNLENNNLSLWNPDGDVPIGWDSDGVKAVEGGNFGYRCEFLEDGSYIQQHLNLSNGRYRVYMYYTGHIFVNYYYTSVFNRASPAGQWEFWSFEFDINHSSYLQFTMLEGDMLDYVAIYPSSYPDNLSFSYLNTNNIININNLLTSIENELFSFVSDNLTIEAFDDNNPDYTILEDMLQANKLFRIDIVYNDGVNSYSFMFFSDPSLISKKIVEGVTNYSIEMFEISSYFKLNGWYLGNLITEYEDETGEVTGQNYYYLVEGYNSISDIIQDGLNQVRRYLIAEYIPIKSFSKSVEVYNKLINTSFDFVGRIVDVWYNEDRDSVFIIVTTQSLQILYRIDYSGLTRISSFSFNYIVRFVNPQDKVVAVVAMQGRDAGSGINESIWALPESTYILQSAYWDYNENNELESYTDAVGDIIYNSATVFRFGVDSDFTPFVSESNPLPWDRFVNSVTGSNNSYSFNSQNDNYRIRLYNIQGQKIKDIYIPASNINNQNKTQIDATVSLLPIGISDYALSNKTFIDMLKDLAVIQNAFFYFKYKVSADSLQVCFKTRESEAVTSALTLDLNYASSYEETFDYIDYSDFETETFKNIVSMKRSLIAYYRNFYGNGIKIIKLTMNQQLNISIGDIVTVSGNLYIVRTLETVIGYENSGSIIESPKLYIELMEVLFA